MGVSKGRKVNIAEPEQEIGKEDSRAGQSEFAVSNINITTMATAQPLLFDREEEVRFIQEHATPAGKSAAVAAFAAEPGWRLDLGPIDQTQRRSGSDVEPRSHNRCT